MPGMNAAPAPASMGASPSPPLGFPAPARTSPPMSTAATATAAATSPLVQVSGEALTVAGHTLPLDQALQVETSHAESRLRNAFFCVTACLGPIAAMIIFTAVEAPALRWGLGLLAAAGPFIAILASFAWKKPWGVIV